MTPKQNTLLAIGLVIVLTIVGVFLYSQGKNSPTTNDTAKPVVVTSFYPLYFFVTEIGGDLVTVHNITPAGAEPHDYELTPRDIITIQESDLLVLNGGGLEQWADDVKAQIKDSQVQTLIAGERLATDMFVDEDGKEVIDPHVWLDPVAARDMVKKIEHALQALDPTNADVYHANAERLDTALWQLDTDYRTKLTNCIQDTFVTSHVAFSYLAKRYGLKQLAIAGIEPGSEPTPQDLVRIATFVREHNIRMIFFETLVSPRLSQTLAREVGVQTMVMNPIEGLTDTEIAQGKNYITEMQTNLRNLRIALQCP